MQIINLYLIFTMLAVIWLDVTRYRIPNWLVGGMLLAYTPAVFLYNLPWLSGLEAMGIAFAIGYVVFALKLMGGGDIKLLIVCALWMGMERSLEFILLVGIYGGVFALVVWGSRKIEPFIPRKKEWGLPRILKEGEPIPYGVAIAGAFLWMLFKGQL